MRYCTDEASLAAVGLVGLDQVEWLDRVREDLESYRAALTWLLDRGRPAEASDMRGACSSSGSSVGTRPRGSDGMNRS